MSEDLVDTEAKRENMVRLRTHAQAGQNRKQERRGVKVKTMELKGRQLDWAVALCEGRITNDPYANVCGDAVKQDGWRLTTRDDGEEVEWWPTCDWSQGGPIIERESISIADPNSNQAGERGQWHAWCGSRNCDGESALMAAMRAYVAHKTGDTIDIPEGVE